MEIGINELAKRVGVSSRTLRYYDEIGLLRPVRRSEAGYRFYGEEQVERLWQILFYRERGMGLERIQEVMAAGEEERIAVMEEHLVMLEKERVRLERLVSMVRQTIGAMKEGVCAVDSRLERFELFKQELAADNEALYGDEVRERYGAEAADAANRRLLKMSEAEYGEFKRLEDEIRRRLEVAVENKVVPESEEGQRIVDLHKQWLLFTWTKYSAKAHRGLVRMYTGDVRFTAYYDEQVSGCAEFLQKAVEVYAESRLG